MDQKAFPAFEFVLTRNQIAQGEEVTSDPYLPLS